MKFHFISSNSKEAQIAKEEFVSSYWQSEPESADVIIPIGGDGILLKSLHDFNNLNKPFFGYGIDKYSYIDMDLVPDLIFGTIISAHNGYLALLVQFGMIFGGAILFIIVRQSFLNIKRFISKQNNNTFYLFVIIFGLLTSFFETLITGINEFHTILFLFSLAILNFSYYESSDNK